MDPNQGHRNPPLASSSVTSTTTSHGPHTTTTTHSTSSDRNGTNVIDYGPQSTSTTITHPAVTTTTHIPHPHPQPQPQLPAPTASTHRPRGSSIRIRRPEATSVNHQNASNPQPAPPLTDGSWQAGRRRSSSEPRPPSSALFTDDNDLRRQMTATPLQPLYEDASSKGDPQGLAPQNGPPPSRGPSIRRQGMQRQQSAFSIRRKAHSSNQNTMESNVVDVLDVIDPEISALTTLNNVQNSLFLPNLPWLYNRQPTYDLRQATSDSSDEEMGTTRTKTRETQLLEMTQAGEMERAAEGEAQRAGLRRTNTIDSTLSTMDEGPDHHYAVLPHGASLPGWTDEEKAILDDHVRHVLHSKRAKFKRSMHGFGRYVRNPLGFIVTLYFFLITFWGAAWVLFLIGWIYVGEKQDYLVEICDQVLTALFCVVGITMFPFRLVDTYHMAFVAYYAHRTWRLRNERGLRDLKDHNELPRQSMAIERGEESHGEIEEAVQEELPVLTDE